MKGDETVQRTNTHVKRDVRMYSFVFLQPIVPQNSKINSYIKKKQQQ